MIISQNSFTPNPAELAEICAQAAESKNATDISILEIGDIVGITEYFVICTGSNVRLVSAIVDAIQRGARKFSVKPVSIEGQRQAEWVCMDYGNIVVHVFEKEARNFYRIERLFKDAPEVAWRSLDQATA